MQIKLFKFIVPYPWLWLHISLTLIQSTSNFLILFVNQKKTIFLSWTKTGLSQHPPTSSDIFKQQSQHWSIFKLLIHPAESIIQLRGRSTCQAWSGCLNGLSCVYAFSSLRWASEPFTVHSLPSCLKDPGLSGIKPGSWFRPWYKVLKNVSCERCKICQTIKPKRNKCYWVTLLYSQ